MEFETLEDYISFYINRGCSLADDTLNKFQRNMVVSKLKGLEKAMIDGLKTHLIKALHKENKENE